jgi:hypothetical protein
MVRMSLELLRSLVERHKVRSRVSGDIERTGYENWFAFDGYTGEVWVVPISFIHKLYLKGGDLFETRMFAVMLSSFPVFEGGEYVGLGRIDGVVENGKEQYSNRPMPDVSRYERVELV